MPRVKIDYVVSVSSEDPENQANNLLAGEVSKKKWLCAKGEQSCSVVLQLARAVTISAIHIGAHHAAFVEVLVGTSERPNDDFEVLVPRCVFCGPAESRRGEGAARVRSFGAAELGAAARRRWDRLRLLCSQPYDKHSQFGLCFVHIFEPEQSGAAPGLSLDAFSSDEEVFRPGELFAQHRRSHKENDHKSQIRQATSLALKNISDADTKLKKTPIAKHKRESCDPGGSEAHARTRDSLMYTPDEDQPHAKIDRVLTKHKEERKKNDELQNVKNTNVKKDNVETNNNQRKNKDDSFSKKKEKSKKNLDRSASSSRTPQNRNRDSEKRKRQLSSDDDDDDDGDHGRGAADSSTALRGVVFALSGFVQPERGRLRDAALALGAAYRPAWTPDCTHLVCAFANTPKLRQVAASAPHAHVVSAAWLRACAAHARRLPEARFALRPAAPAAPPPPPPPAASAEEDTDEEIEKALRRQPKKRRPDAAPAAPAADASPSRGEGSQGPLGEGADGGETTEPESSGSSEEEGEEGQEGRARPLGAFLEGHTLALAEGVGAAGFCARLLRRYARAYGAALVPAHGPAQLRLGTAPGQLRPDWLWRCHRAARLLPADADADAHTHND